MMSHASSMKQLGSRNMGFAIEIMEWSNKMDLIAYGTDKGEVIVQRLNWQKIVTYPPIGENVFIRSLSWQLDQTILAVGYSNGKVLLLDVEAEDVVSSFMYEESIKKLYFTKSINAPDYKSSYRNSKELTFDFFLPKLPTLSGIVSSSKTAGDEKSFAKGSPCFLVVLTKSGKVHLLLMGALKTGTIDLSQHLEHPLEMEVYDVHLSSTFNAVYALVRDGNQLKVLHFNNHVLEEYISPMLYLALHSANILETRNYINETIQCMHEAWETVLLEMDNKLTKYANSQPEGSLAADFLELLVFGYATDEIESFLMTDLTEKGVKKLANSVDLSYSTLQSLVAKPLQSAAVNMFYFLNTIKGLGRISYFFEHLICTEAASQALRLCGSYLMKVLELQQVIDQCVNDMKLFFSWLGVVIVRLHQQDIPEDMQQVTPEDTIYLAEYLNSFEDSLVENEDGTLTKRKFNLEKVGQYLENKNLHQIYKSDAHHMWNKMLEENECLSSCALLYPHEKQLSLIQQRDKMISAIDEIFKKPNENTSAAFRLTAGINCSTIDNIDNDFVSCSFCTNDATKCDMLVTAISFFEVLVLEFNMDFTTLKCTRVNLMPGPFSCASTTSLRELRLIDLQFYNENIVSFLLKPAEDSLQTTYFLQFPLNNLNERSTLHALPNNVNLTDAAIAHSIQDLVDSTMFKAIDGHCTQLAVSGSRKIVTVLSEANKKMTIFEMEIEDDEDETEISQNSLLEMSKESVTSSNS